MIISAKLDVTKLDKTAFHVGKTRADGSTPKYCDITLLENRNGKDQYGNDFMVVQDLGKERRLAGERGVIIGNAKIVSVQQVTPPPAAKELAAEAAADDDDLAF